MRAGELRHRVTIQEKQVTHDAEGLSQETWVDVLEARAAIDYLSGREYWSAQAVNAEVSVRVRMRYRQGIVPQMRVAYRGRIFLDILAVIPAERDRELQLMCRESV